MNKHHQDAETATPAIDMNEKFSKTGNLAPLVDISRLTAIAANCFEGMQGDTATMGDWHKSANEARKLAKMESDRDLPFSAASDVQTPTLAIACMQFAARAYPSILNNDQPVKVKVFGSDEDGQKKDRAERVSKFMSWQVMEGIKGWDEDVDYMLHILPLVGTAFKKVFFCESEGRPVSELVPMENLTFDMRAKRGNIPRITEKMVFYEWEIQERVRRGTWIDIEYGEPDGEGIDGEETSKPVDDATPHVFYEQHCRIDIDDDGYPEPYIVMLHGPTQKVVRISPNWRPEDVERNSEGLVVSIEESATYIPFKFIPDPDNRAVGLGYGTLMIKVGNTINTILNQLIDAGTLANAGGGIINKSIRGLNVGSNEIDLSKWYKGEIPDDVSKLFVEFPRPKPDPTLFALLGFLNDMAKEVTSTTDALSGNVGTNIQPTTLLALIDQGEKVFNAIYKRIFRSLKEEYQALYRLNRAHIPDETYLTFHDQQVSKEDFTADDMDVSPAADPQMANDFGEMAKVGVMEKFLGDPHFNQGALRRKIVHAAKLDESLLISDEDMQQQQGPDPAALAEIEKLKLESDKISVSERKVDIDQQKADLETQKMQIAQRIADADVALKKAQALKALADAEAAEVGVNMQEYARHLQVLKAAQDDEKHQMEIDNAVHERRISGHEGQSGVQGADRQDQAGSGGPIQNTIQHF